MKITLSAILLHGIAVGAIAAAPQEAAFGTPALLVAKTGESREIRLLSATRDTFIYQEKDGPREPVEARMPEGGTVFLFEPQDFSEAMDLYQARKYRDARLAFIRVKERYKPVELLENSPAAMAAFYEMECLRRTGDLDGLAAALQCFTRVTITRETLLGQIELYVLWDAVRTKSWERLETLAKERADTRLPGDQRAQVAMCHGLALEGLNRPEEAIPAYQTALTADSGASEEIAREAALRILAIHHSNPEVRQAIKLRDAPDVGRSSKGFAGLHEAAAVARMFETTFGAGTPLPGEFKEFLKYRAVTPATE